MGAQLSPNVAVIGGGCAGLAAAVSLAEKNIPVTLFEASPQLGGRARGLGWKNQRLDNGQHIFLGAYSETLRLLKLANVDENLALLRLPLQLTMQDEFELTACPTLPAPLHILAGLATAKGLSWAERYAAVRFMVWMRLNNFTLNQDESLASLLTRKAQPVKLTKLLWEPICLAALNTPLYAASGQVFLNVLRDSFAKTKSDSDMLLPRQDLSTLMAEPLAAYITGKGGKVNTNAPVATIKQTDNNFLVATNDGVNVQFSHVIIAVSPFRLADISSQLPALADQVSMTEKFTYQPIYTVYLQYPENIKLDTPMIGLAGKISQWVFDRGALYGQHGLLAVVISAEGTHQQMTQENLAAQVAKELSATFPHLPQPLWHKVIAEKRATFTCHANLQRPAQLTAIENLYLAGDYTVSQNFKDNYPATIEGAVRSGVQCAKYIADKRH
jgi:squalene-associated FAD-dependent desaturase